MTSGSDNLRSQRGTTLLQQQQQIYPRMGGSKKSLGSGTSLQQLNQGGGGSILELGGAGNNTAVSNGGSSSNSKVILKKRRQGEHQLPSLMLPSVNGATTEKLQVEGMWWKHENDRKYKCRKRLKIFEFQSLKIHLLPIFRSGTTQLISITAMEFIEAACFNCPGANRRTHIESWLMTY